MTLSPVFRSQRAVQLLADEGVWDRLAPDMEAQANGVRRVYTDFESLIDDSFRTESPHVPSSDEVVTADGLHFLEEFLFILVLLSFLV